MEPAISLRRWAKQLPYSRPVYPNSYLDWSKYFFWRLITPLHNPARDALLHAGIIKHRGRQDYLLGRLAPGETIQSLTNYLITQGYGNHFIAWEDEGQVVSLRHLDSFKHQYHVRLFEDGEVRGHWEYTPECHMVLHMKEVGMEDRREEFLRLVGERITRA